MTTYDVSTGKEIFLAEIAKELSGTELYRAIAALSDDERENYDRLHNEYNRRDPAEEIQNRVTKCEMMAARMRRRRAALLDQHESKMKVIEDLKVLHENALLAGENEEAATLWKRIRTLKDEAADLLDQAGSTVDLDRISLVERIRNDIFNPARQEALEIQTLAVNMIDDLSIDFQVALRDAYAARTAFLDAFRRAGQVRDKACAIAGQATRIQHYLPYHDRARLGAGEFELPKKESWPVREEDIHSNFGITWATWPDPQLVGRREREWALEEWSRLVDRRNRERIEGKDFDQALDRKLERLHRIAFGG